MKLDAELRIDDRIVGRFRFDLEPPRQGRLRVVAHEVHDPLPPNTRVELAIADLTPDEGLLVG